MRLPEKLPNELFGYLFSFFDEKDLAALFRVSKECLVESSNEKIWRSLVYRKLFFYYEDLNKSYMHPLMYLNYKEVAVFNRVCRKPNQALSILSPYFNHESQSHTMRVAEQHLLGLYTMFNKATIQMEKYHAFLFFKLHAKIKYFPNILWELNASEDFKKVIIKRALERYIPTPYIATFLSCSLALFSFNNPRFFNTLLRDIDLPPLIITFPLIAFQFIGTSFASKLINLFLTTIYTFRLMHSEKLIASAIEELKNSFFDRVAYTNFIKNNFRLLYYFCNPFTFPSTFNNATLKRIIDFVYKLQENAFTKSNTLEIAEKYKEIQDNTEQYVIDIHLPIDNLEKRVNFQSENLSSKVIKFGLFAKNKCIAVTQEWLYAKDFRKLKLT